MLDTCGRGSDWFLGKFVAWAEGWRRAGRGRGGRWWGRGASEAVPGWVSHFRASPEIGRHMARSGPFRHPAAGNEPW